MEKIKEYKTIHGETPEALDNALKDALNEGYQPYGDPYCVPNLANLTSALCQAMVQFPAERKLSTAMPSLK